MTESVGTPKPSFRVRPYTVTKGRTRPEIEINIEAMVQTTGSGRNDLDRRSSEVRRIIELCATPMALAEVSAHLKLPLQVVSVLLGDLIAEGAINCLVDEAASEERPDLRLLERVLDGLQNL